MHFIKQNTFTRMLACFALAIAATVTSFSVMDTMVRAGPIELKRASYFQIRPIVAEAEVLEVRSKYPDLVPAPMLQPRWTDAKIALEWKEGRDGFGCLLGMCGAPYFPPSFSGHAVAIPIVEPRPIYPKIALSAEIEGRCDVYFDIDHSGYALGIDAVCTNPIFKRSAEVAVQNAKFNPILGGIGEVFTVEYKLSE